jgi:hypothetical protein
MLCHQALFNSSLPVQLTGNNKTHAHTLILMLKIEFELWLQMPKLKLLLGAALRSTLTIAVPSSTLQSLVAPKTPQQQKYMLIPFNCGCRCPS